MKQVLKPGQKTGQVGGIYRELGPRGGLRETYTTLAEHRRVPPTTSPGATWVLINPTPKGRR